MPPRSRVYPKEMIQREPWGMIFCDVRKAMGLPWRNHGKTHRKLENHGETMGKPIEKMEKPMKPWKNHGKTNRKPISSISDIPSPTKMDIVQCLVRKSMEKS